MPIGNLTSQIFANIYLNELDRFVVHVLRPKRYLRYGDDFILICPDLEKLKKMRLKIIGFLADQLCLKINPKNEKIFKTSHGLRFLGVVIQPEGRNLKRRNRRRIQRRLNFRNVSSYYGLNKKYTLFEFDLGFDWWISEMLEAEF